MPTTRSPVTPQKGKLADAAAVTAEAHGDGAERGASAKSRRGQQAAC